MKMCEAYLPQDTVVSQEINRVHLGIPSFFLERRERAQVVRPAGDYSSPICFHPYCVCADSVAFPFHCAVGPGDASRRCPKIIPLRYDSLPSYVVAPRVCSDEHINTNHTSEKVISAGAAENIERTLYIRFTCLGLDPTEIECRAVTWTR